MTIGSKTITQAPQTYSYKSYFEALLSYSKDAKKSFLVGAHFTKDGASLESAIADSVDALRNEIFTPSTASVATSNEIDMYGKMHLEMGYQPKLLLGGVEVSFALKPNSPSFYLMCNDDKLVAKLEFTEAILYVHRSKIAPHIIQGHSSGLEIASAKYPLVRGEVKAITLTRGVFDVLVDNVVNGQLPRRIFIAFVEHDAFTGSFTKNPFNFKNLGLNFLATYVNGVQFPSKAFTPDYTNGLYIREYMSLFESTNKINLMDSNINISRDSYPNGMTIYGINFAPDLSDGCCGTSSHANVIKNGQLRIECHFKTALKQTTNMLCYLEYDNMLEIDSTRNVTTNYV